jgi:hypothetical protein
VLLQEVCKLVEELSAPGSRNLKTPRRLIGTLSSGDCPVDVLGRTLGDRGEYLSSC